MHTDHESVAVEGQPDVEELPVILRAFLSCWDEQRLGN